MAAKSYQEPEQCRLAREHSFKLMSHMQYLREQQAMCDANLKIGEIIFPIHRVVLAAASAYFKAMFTSGMSESRKETINIHGVGAETFTTVLDFIYCGHVQVCESNVQQLLPAAMMFQLEDLETVCCKFLKRQLDASNSVGIYLFAEAHACEELSKSALEYVYRNILQVRRQEEFLQVDSTRILQFLESEELNIQSELQIFEAAMEWMLYDVPKRRGVLGKILERVRLPLISSKFLKDYHLKNCEDSSLQLMLDSMLENYCSCQLIAGGLQKVYIKPRRSARKCFLMVGGYCRQKGGRWSDIVSLPRIEKFDPFSHKRDTVPIMADLNYPRSGLGVATVGGLVYAIGGEVDSLMHDITECYDPALNEWSVMSHLNAPRVACGVCVVEDFIFVIGGWVGSEIGKNIERYDPQKDCWEIVGKVETKRYHLGVAEMKGIIYAAGGFSELGEELKLVESYNPVADKWTSLTDMHLSRAYLGLAAMGEYLYAVGGSNEMGGALRSVERYDVATNQWTKVTAMNSPRAAAAVAVNGSELYVIGGRTDSEEFSPPITLTSIDVYDPQENKWKHVADLSFSRCEFGVGVL